MSLQYAVSRRSVGSHCTPGGVTPPLGINDRGVIQPGESLIPLTPAIRDTQFMGESNSTQAHSNYLICMRFIRVSTVCANLVLIVHTLCHYCEMLATAAGNKVSKHLEAP